jgi:hypothetical protein
MCFDLARAASSYCAVPSYSDSTVGWTSLSGAIPRDGG